MEERGATAELFRSADLLVRKVGGFSAAACVVTFASFADDRRIDRPGFGEHFLHSRVIDAVHVISRENDWYQYPEIPEAMAAVHAATGPYDRVVTYGSSMGAYAAIRLAGLAGAHAALALSPQYSIDRSVARFENRWTERSRLFRPVWERTLPFPELSEAYVAYDPANLDARHIALLGRRFRFTPVRLPMAGHPVTGFLMELGLLEVMVRQVCAGALDVASLQADAWARREESAQHFVVRAATARRRATKLAMLEHAARLAPGSAAVHSQLGVMLGKTGRFAEADAAHRRSLEITPDHPNMLVEWSHTAQLQGDPARALALMEQAFACSGGATLYLPRIARLRAQAASGRWSGLRAWRRRWRRGGRSSTA